MATKKKQQPAQTRARWFIAALCLALLWPAAAKGVEKFDPGRLEFFEKKIRPLLANNCYNCHSANTNSRGGLRVDDRNGLLRGGDRGPAVVPGDPEKSRLIQAVLRKDAKLKMPPEQPLFEDQIADLKKWIADGAAWPAVETPVEFGKPDADYERLRKEHWAWQPLARTEPPAVNDAAWPSCDVDRFILATLEAKGLQPASDASKRNLIRRVSFDLTGLPPTPDEVAAFLADDSPRAFEKVVDRLLVSPAFGERWGRHWLDVARYGESTGSARNLPYPQAWRYRDYVIDAFHNDKPYDQFIREQIAGDLLPADTPEEREEQLIATGFLALGVKDVNQRFKARFIMDNIDEQIDAVSRAFLAVTASCARCHDHKFDPIPTTDYYALAGIFHSTDLCAGLRNKMGGGGLDYYDTSLLLRHGTEPTATPEQIALATENYEKANAEWEAIRDTPEGLEKGPNGRPKQQPIRQKMERLKAELAALTDPKAVGKVILGVRDAKTIGDTELRVRGEAEKLGPAVPRGFLGILEWTDMPRVNSQQSGRLELALWLTSPSNPLTPRVMANRVWQHLFGQGLVRSVDNFGVMGDSPSHPELLDHLAVRFMNGGWSVKKLVRELVLSRTYRMSAEATAKNMEIDPSNRFVWRHRPRRLDAEEIRDTMLLLAGNLNLSRPEGSPAHELKVTELRNNGPEAKKLAEYAEESTERSVYLPLLRTLTPLSLEVFDFAEQGMVTGKRNTTTVAPQALYLLNDPFVRRQSQALAAELLAEAELAEPVRLQRAYESLLGRPATDEEIKRCQSYLDDYASAAGGSRPAAWESLCQALFGSVEFRYLK